MIFVLNYDETDWIDASVVFEFIDSNLNHLYLKAANKKSFNVYYFIFKIKKKFNEKSTNMARHIF